MKISYLWKNRFKNNHLYIDRVVSSMYSGIISSYFSANDWMGYIFYRMRNHTYFNRLNLPY